MGLNNEINSINRSIKENQQNAERLQRLSDNRQNKKIILQNTLLSGILGALEDGADVYQSAVIDNIIVESIRGADIENNDIIKEYAQNIYYSTVRKAESIHKKEAPKQKELTAYQVEQLKLARERLEFQRQKEVDRLKKQEQKEANRITYTRQKETIRRAAETKQSLCNVLMLVILAPIMILVGFIDAASKSK